MIVRTEIPNHNSGQAEVDLDMDRVRRTATDEGVFPQPCQAPLIVAVIR